MQSQESSSDQRVADKAVRTSGEPLVSVIVPVYNGQRYLAFALQSIFDQDYYPFEVILVDDGSVDGSAEIARRFPELRYIYQPNQGVATARNVGIDAAKGAFIAFLDADDLWAPNKLSVQIGYHLKHPQVDYTVVRVQNFLEPGINRPAWLSEDQLLKDETAHFPSTLVVRKSVFERIGIFDPQYTVGEDTEWFVRAKDAYVPMGILPDVLVRRRIHNSNLSYQKPSVRLSMMMKIVKESVDRRRVGKAR